MSHLLPQVSPAIPPPHQMSPSASSRHRTHLTGSQDVDVLVEDGVAVLHEEALHLVLDGVGEVMNDEGRGGHARLLERLLPAERAVQLATPVLLRAARHLYADDDTRSREQRDGPQPPHTHSTRVARQTDYLRFDSSYALKYNERPDLVLYVPICIRIVTHFDRK